MRFFINRLRAHAQPGATHRGSLHSISRRGGHRISITSHHTRVKFMAALFEIDNAANLRYFQYHDMLAWHYLPWAWLWLALMYEKPCWLMNAVTSGVVMCRQRSKRLLVSSYSLPWAFFRLWRCRGLHPNEPWRSRRTFVRSVNVGYSMPGDERPETK